MNSYLTQVQILKTSIYPKCFNLAFSIPADFTQEECPPGPIGIDDEMILIRVPKAVTS